MLLLVDCKYMLIQKQGHSFSNGKVTSGRGLEQIPEETQELLEMEVNGVAGTTVIKVTPNEEHSKPAVRIHDNLNGLLELPCISVDWWMPWFVLQAPGHHELNYGDVGE